MATRVVLDAKLDSANAEDLKQSLLKSQGDDIELDGSAVEQIGGQCLELLMCVQHLWGAAGNSVVLKNASDEMVDDLNRFGLTAQDFEGKPA